MASTPANTRSAPKPAEAEADHSEVPGDPVDQADKRQEQDRAEASRKAIQELSTELLKCDSLDALASRLLSGLMVFVGADNGSVMLADEGRQHLRIVADIGLPPEARQNKVPIADSVSGIVMYVGEPLLLRGRVKNQSPGQRTISSSLVVPISCRGERVGVVNLNRSPDSSSFDEADLEVASAAVASFGAMFDAVHHPEESSKHTLATVEALAATIEAKDPYTRGHCDRARLHATGVAKIMGVAPDVIEQLALGATLHDIGKIGVPESVLLKPDRLTKEEYEMVKRHPSIGVDILRPVGLSQTALDAVLHHHERLDGSGYPDGLKGVEIPLVARIMAVVDAFDAMTITRPYRSALTVEYAFNELKRCSGTQFDPMVVVAFLQYCEQQQLDKKLTSIETARKATVGDTSAHDEPVSE